MNWRDLCVISCYGTALPGVTAFFNALDRALQQRGIRLLLLTTAQDETLEPASIEVPYLLSGFDAEIADSFGQAPFHPVTPALLHEELQAAGAQDHDTVARGVAKCEAFYRALGTLAAPCAAFLWNTTLPHGRIARNTMTASGVPAWCLERGWLPRTFQLHANETNGYSNFFLDFALNRGMPALLERYGAQAEPFDSARSYYRAQRIQKYDAGNGCTEQELRRKYGLGEGRLVVCFSAAEGSAAGLPEVPAMAYTSPDFCSVSEALEQLARLLAPYPGLQVLVQEHPLQRAIGKPAAMPPGFIATEGENIHSLLEAADYLVFIGATTVHAEALLVDTPRLSMSRHAASLAGASYGLVEEGKAAVAAWLGDTRSEQAARAARALVNYLCDEELIREEGLPGFVRHGVEDFADFIAGLARPNELPPDERLNRFLLQASAMLKAPPA
jgi:hypothetical protein